ncbi:MAG TPA: hypothetical protein VKA86_02590 [Candidatus Krumholzibacteria bacterium]|nr:hypothetical protein [Candidatus Krumholzibacteria bacterium]
MTEPHEHLVTSEAELLGHEVLDFVSPKKRHVFQIATADADFDERPMDVTRWMERDLPTEAATDTAVEIRTDVFTYAAPADGEVAWHVNFADPELFFGYGVDLLAQDELQIAEHPALAALRVRLCRTAEVKPYTARGGRATPVLVTNVLRRVAIDLDPRPDVGLPRGIYGYGFTCASLEAIEAVCEPLDPPAQTNLLAMAALSHGTGNYCRGEIQGVLDTAYTAFVAACEETRRLHGRPAATVVHTGYWGCGAFGGNRELMVAVQVIAARAAGVDRLVLHTVRQSGRPDAERGVDIAAGTSPSEAAAALAARDFEWGKGDGT